MSKVINESYSLATLKTFDPNVFIDSKETSQELCNLMLALSVFCNDVKDITMFKIAVEETRPKSLDSVSKESGNFGGLMLFIQRLFILKLNELSNLLLEHMDVISSNEFSSLFKKLPKEKKIYWDSAINTLVNYNNSTNQTTENNSFRKVLGIIRHKIGGHYDAKEIMKGYKTFFIKNKSLAEPYLSAGSAIRDTRFFYADASAQGCYYNKQKDFDVKDFDTLLNNILKDLAEVAWILVIRFIMSKSSWKQQTLKRIPKIDEFKF